MKAAQPSLKTQAAEKSKKAILDAAEQLFAARGFEKTSLQDICDLAGVARGTPGYFFGSKEGLYQAVLDRSFLAPLVLVQSIGEQLKAPGADPEALFRATIEQFFDFQLTHPMFVRLTQWEALGGGQYLGQLPLQLQVFKEALQLLQEEMRWEGEPEQFLIDLTALCWFPLAHAETFLKPLGMDLTDPETLRRRKAHVVQVLLAHYQPHRREP